MPAARKFLGSLVDPIAAPLLNAPDDDEAEIPEERAAVEPHATSPVLAHDTRIYFESLVCDPVHLDRSSQERSPQDQPRVVPANSGGADGLRGCEALRTSGCVSVTTACDSKSCSTRCCEFLMSGIGAKRIVETVCRRAVARSHPTACSREALFAIAARTVRLRVPSGTRH